MKRPILAAFIALAVVAVGAVWFWSLGRIPVTVPPFIAVLDIERDGIEIKRTGEESWQRAEGGENIRVGDEVRSDASGRATLRFFDFAEARIQEDSSLAIESVLNPWISADGGAHVHMKLLSGRVWSHVTRTYDLRNTYSVETDVAVATARGTAFDVQKHADGSTSVLVADATVELDAEGGLYVPEGFKVTRAAGGAWGTAESLSRDDIASEWYAKNRVADSEFAEKTTAKLMENMELRGRTRPDTFIGTLASLSERLHIAFAGDEAPRLRAAYLGRRMYGVKTLIDGGKSGLAFQVLTRIEQETQDLMKSPDAEAAGRYLWVEFGQVSRLFEDVLPGAESYRLKLRLEDLLRFVTEHDPAARLYTYLLSADMRLAEASTLVVRNELEEAALTIEAGRGGISNGERDLAEVREVLEAQAVAALQAKIASLKVRANAVSSRLAAAELPPVVEAVSEAATSTDPLPEEKHPPESEALTADAPATWQKLTLSVQPNPLDVGQTAYLRVIGTRADGTTGDLTGSASFARIGAFGTLNGSVFSSDRAGTVAIEASVPTEQGIMTARANINVVELVTVTRLDLVPQGQTTVRRGEQIPIIARATYSNGETGIVTPEVTWFSSDPNVGSVTNGIFTAWINGHGSVTVSGRYTENGVSVTGNLVFTVVPNN